MVKSPKKSPKKSPVKKSPPPQAVRTSSIKKVQERKSPNKIPSVIAENLNNTDFIESVPFSYFQKSPSKKKHHIVLYRSLRVNEWDDILSNKGVNPQCDSCPRNSKDLEKLEKDNCCKRTISQHVTSGSKFTSRYISTSLDENIVGMWASLSADADNLDYDNIYIEMKIPFDGNKVVPLTDNVIKDLKLGLGVMSRNFAKSSREVVVEDGIPLKNIKAAYRVKCIPKSEYDKYPEGVFSIKNKPYEFHKLMNKKTTRKTPFYMLSWKIWDKKHGTYEKRVEKKKTNQCKLTKDEKKMYKSKK
jgi:hypothetical protein